MLIISHIQFFVKVFCVKSVWLLFCDFYKLPMNFYWPWKYVSETEGTLHVTRCVTPVRNTGQAAGWLAVYTVNDGVKECVSIWPS